MPAQTLSYLNFKAILSLLRSYSALPDGTTIEGLACTLTQDKIVIAITGELQEQLVNFLNAKEGTDD